MAPTTGADRKRKQKEEKDAIRAAEEEKRLKQPKPASYYIRKLKNRTDVKVGIVFIFILMLTFAAMSFFDRSREVSSFASTEGFKFDEASRSDLSTIWPSFSALKRGMNQYAVNIIEGFTPGLRKNFTSFDYVFSERMQQQNRRGRVASVSSYSKTNEFTGIIVDLPEGLDFRNSSLTLIPKALLSDAQKAKMTDQDVDEYTKKKDSKDDFFDEDTDVDYKFDETGLSSEKPRVSKSPEERAAALSAAGKTVSNNDTTVQQPLNVEPKAIDGKYFNDTFTIDAAENFDADAFFTRELKTVLLATYSDADIKLNRTSVYYFDFQDCHLLVYREERMTIEEIRIVLNLIDAMIPKLPEKIELRASPPPPPPVPEPSEPSPAPAGTTDEDEEEKTKNNSKEYNDTDSEEAIKAKPRKPIHISSSTSDDTIEANDDADLPSESDADDE